MNGTIIGLFVYERVELMPLPLEPRGGGCAVRTFSEAGTIVGLIVARPLDATITGFRVGARDAFEDAGGSHEAGEAASPDAFLELDVAAGEMVRIDFHNARSARVIVRAALVVRWRRAFEP